MPLSDPRRPRRGRRGGTPRRIQRRRQVALAGAAVVVLAAVLIARQGPGRSTSTPASHARSTLAARATAASSSPVPGFLLISDRGNDRTILVDARHHVHWSFPTAHDLALGRRLNFNDDGFVAAGGTQVVSNEEDAQTIVSINIRTHALTHLFGTPGVKGGGPHLLNTPDDAYPLPDGSVIVADAYNCRIVKIVRHAIVRQWGDGTCRHDPPRSFGAVNGDTPLPDGGMLVSEIPPGPPWIDEIGPDGRLRFAIQPPLTYPSDPQPLAGGRILVADYASPGQILVVNDRGNVVWRYGPTHGPGELDHPSLALPLPNGDIAVNDDYRQRVVVIDPATNRIVWQYGHTGHGGRAAGYLNTPDGVDFVPADASGRPLWSAVHHPGALVTLRGAAGAASGTSARTGSARGSAPALHATALAPLAGGVQDAALAALPGGGALLAGGIDPSGASRATVARLLPAAAEAPLAEPVHDAAMVELGGRAYLFGGGVVRSYDRIVSIDPATGASAVVGRLPQPRSDLAAVAVGGTAYLIGGFDGTRALDTILAWRPGGVPRVVAHLPQPLRYAAAAAAPDGRVIIAGGSVAGGASPAILAFDPRSGAVTEIGSLPSPVTHAAAATLGATVYLIGGRGAAPESATGGIVAIDPATGTAGPAGSLPVPTSDAAAVALGGRIVLVGGRSGGVPQPRVLALAPTRG